MNRAPTGNTNTPGGNFLSGVLFLLSGVDLAGYNARVSPDSASNRRTSPRIEVFAQAEVKARDVQIMEVRNVSSGGVYLVGTPLEYPDLTPGKDLGVVIFGSEEGLGDDPDFNIICHARIIRVDEGYPGKRPPGFGATIDPVDDDNRERLTRLLLRAEHFRVGDPRR
jgi:hypothetical protein